MNFKRNTTILMAAATMLCMGNVFAAEPAQPVQAPAAVVEQNEADAIRPLEQRQLLQTKGEIVEIGEGFIVVKGEGDCELVKVMLGEINDKDDAVEDINDNDYDTFIVDGKNGKLKKFSKLKIGMNVSVYYDAAMTRSIPPQTRGYAVVIEREENNTGRYFVVDRVLKQDADSVQVIDINHGVIATITKDVCKDLSEIERGSKLMLWSRVMTMSLPALTNAEKVVILD